MSYTPTPDDPVYTAIGRAISAWAEFEEEAFRFYCELMAQPDPLCAVAFFSLGTFSGKLELVNATIFRRRSFLRLLGGLTAPASLAALAQPGLGVGRFVQ
jgi:hypothetical protein